jgi:glycosyltransferase involved in cell wall biosynthesis
VAAIRTALLVPCYNAERFLPRLVEQVGRLRPAFDEVLLADDGSRDDTAGRAERLGFRVLRLPRNLGPGGARNALARASRAEWIHFHDVDDEIAPDYLARVEAAGAGADAVLHAVDFVGEDDRRLEVRWQVDPAALAARPAETLLRSPLPTMSSFLRRDVFLDLGGFDEELRCFEDGDLHFRLGASPARLRWVPETLEVSLRHGAGAGGNQHYCWTCRVAFLERYAASQPAGLHRAIADEAERAAVQLLRHGDTTAARRAIALARRLGNAVPASANPMMRLLRGVVPATWLLRLQDRWRNL